MISYPGMEIYFFLFSEAINLHWVDWWVHLRGSSGVDDKGFLVDQFPKAWQNGHTSEFEILSSVDWKLFSTSCRSNLFCCGSVMIGIFFFCYPSKLYKEFNHEKLTTMSFDWLMAKSEHKTELLELYQGQG